ncbi:unnamed protein product [Lactuca saligna]|uniref:Uncharacterized protein n=1 Tax=Lactuca saligna TaxID=75948 RepID=A0AA35V0G4_LACSI|nr:unnamed protein product [Lactuca saligna]
MFFQIKFSISIHNPVDQLGIKYLPRIRQVDLKFPSKPLVSAAAKDLICQMLVKDTGVQILKGLNTRSSILLSLFLLHHCTFDIFLIKTLNRFGTDNYENGTHLTGPIPVPIPVPILWNRARSRYFETVTH